MENLARGKDSNGAPQFELLCISCGSNREQFKIAGGVRTKHSGLATKAGGEKNVMKSL